MTRLLHLNGPPGIGKSTLARRWAEDHPGTLVCDIDILRTFVGGWQADFAGAGGQIRPVALAMIRAHLGSGHDVVLPQLLANPVELAKFEAAAHDAGAAFVTCLLVDTEDTEEAAVRRFHRRSEPAQGQPDPWHDQVRAIVKAEGGEDVLRAYHRRLRQLVLDRPETVVVTSADGDVDATYAALLAALARGPGRST